MSMRMNDHWLFHVYINEKNDIDSQSWLFHMSINEKNDINSQSWKNDISYLK